ncbi:zinc finger, C3HC4 type (RING finger) protein, partial [Toxoplasma gondii CAST]
SLGFCIFPYSLSATQGCMAGDMDGTNIPVSVFYTYFQYSIWTALILALVARRLSKFFKRRAIAVEAEARRGREASRMQAPETPSVSMPPVEVSPGGLSRTSLSSSLFLDPSHSPVSPPAVGEGTTTPNNGHAGSFSPASVFVAPPEVDNSEGTEDELQGFDDDGSSSASSSLPSSAEQSFIQGSDARRASFDSFSTRHGEERRSERRRTRAFTNATLLLMGYRMLIQRLCRRPHTMWSLLMWRRDTLVASRYHAYQEMCSIAAFLLSAHTVSGALVVLLGPIQPWMKAVWLHIACMFIEAVARIQIAKGEERVQNARQVAINPDFFAAGTRRPISNVGVGARASAAAGGTPWGYAFVEEPRDRLLLKQLSSTYFSITERIVDQVTASVAVASSSCCCFPSSVSSPVPSSVESGSRHELTIPLRSQHEENSPAFVPASTSSSPSEPSPSFGDRPSSSASALPAASEEERGLLSSSCSPSYRDSSHREAPSASFVKASEEDVRLVCANEGDLEALGPTEESSSAFAEAAHHSQSWRQTRDEAHQCSHRGQERERRRRGEMCVREAEREKGSNPETTDTLEGKADGRSTPSVGRRRKWGAEKVETEDEVTGKGRDCKRRSRRNLKRERKCISTAHNETHTGSEKETSSQLEKGGRIGEGNQGRNTEDDEEGSVLGVPLDETGHDASNEKRRRRANALFLDSISAFSCSENGDRMPSPLPGSCGESASSCGSGDTGLPSTSPSRCDPSSARIAFEFSSPRVLPSSSSSPSPAAFLVPSSSVDDPAVARSLSATSAAVCDPSSTSSSGPASALSFSACEICAEAAANAILLPCGHGGCCEACARLVVEKEHQRARSQSVTWLREWLGHPSASFLLPLSSRQPGVSSASAGQEARGGDRRSEEQARDAAMMQLPRCPFCRQAVERIVKIDGACGDDRGYIAAHTVAVVTVGTQAERSRRATARLLR